MPTQLNSYSIYTTKLKNAQTRPVKAGPNNSVVLDFSSHRTHNRFRINRRLKKRKVKTAYTQSFLTTNQQACDHPLRHNT